MSLNKENLLLLLKSNVSIMMDRGEELKTNPQLKEVWDKESSLIRENVIHLSDGDIKWVNDNYTEWYKVCGKFGK